MMYLDEMQVVTNEYGFPTYIGRALFSRGRELVSRGRAQEGIAILEQALTKCDVLGSFIYKSALLVWLAEACAMLGQRADEEKWLVQAERFIETCDERYYEVELHRVSGDFLNATGDRSAAEQRYRQAITVAKRQSAKLFQLRASTSLARLWRDQGKRAEARDLLGPIYNWFTEGFDAPDLKDAKALLDELT
jgi:predicted ATPase